MLRAASRFCEHGSLSLVNTRIMQMSTCRTMLARPDGRKPPKQRKDGGDKKPMIQFQFHKMTPEEAKKFKLQTEKKKQKEQWKTDEENRQGTEGNPFFPLGDWKSAIISVVATTFVTVIIGKLFNSEVGTQEISWEEFRAEYLDKGRVARIEVVNRKFARAETTGSDQNIKFSIGSIDAFDRRVDEAQDELGISAVDRIPISYVREVSYWAVAGSLLPTILLLGGIYYISRRSLQAGGAGGMMNVGKSKAKEFSQENNIKIKFKDVAGADEAKEEIMEFVKFLKNPARYERLGAKIPRGAVLSGPPGTGKTLLAKATAGEAGVPFFTVSGSEFVEMFVGVGASRVRDLFAKARKSSPSIIFIDEIDAIGRDRGPGDIGGGSGGGNDERESTLNQLLVELDGFSDREHVVVLAGTNRPDILDKALMRPGRFDRQITIDKPDVKGRKQVYEVYLPKIKMVGDKKLIERNAGKLAALTPGFAGADIANVVNEAALIAARHDSKTVEMMHFEQAIERVSQGIENRSRIPPPEERRAVAYHEAGHAVCSWHLEHADSFLKVTILPRGQSLGYARYLPSDTELPNQLELADKLVMALGGRVSEKMYSNTTSSGAQSDFQTVTDIATRMVTSWGMSKKIGWMNFHEEGSYYTKPFSEETAQLIDKEVRGIVETAHIRCETLLQEYWEDVKKVAEELLLRETLSREDVVRLIGERKWAEKVEEFKYLEEVNGATEDFAMNRKKE